MAQLINESLATMAWYNVEQPGSFHYCFLPVQAQGMGGVPLKYTGMFDVIRKTVQNEGIRGMYKGLTPNLMKIAPAAGISWFVYEESKRILHA